MKIFIICIITFICFLFASCKKEYADYTISSGFNKTACDSTMLENLEVLGRIWGYVKYHHPAFCDDKYDLDYELFELLPQVADANPIDRNRILTEWIDEFGRFSTTQDKYDAILASDSVYDYRTDVTWIRDTARLGAELSERLVQLRIADRKGNYYVSPTIIQNKGVKYPVGNPCFENEKPYAELSDPDYGYRLLSVFRFWNMIEYFFPTKYLTDKDWKDVLPEYILRMAHPIDGDYCKETWRMIAEINDNHAQWNRVELFGEYRALINVGFVENRLLVISPDTIRSYWYEQRSAFQTGDEIIAVDGRPIEYYLSQSREFVPSSHEKDVLAATADNILRSKINKQLRIRYTRNGMQRDTILAGLDIMFNSFEKTYLDQHIEAYKMLDDSIGYIYPAKYATENQGKLAKIISKAKGLVIDLRCYPSGEFIEFFMKYITPYDRESSNLITAPCISLPGIFFRHNYISSGVKFNKYNGEIVVIVNETTQSYAETSAQSMQRNPKVKVIGTQSAGANGNVSYFTLPGGITSCFSGLGWYYDDDWCVQRQGVKIDYEVRPTIEGIKASRDEMLDAAIKIIQDKTEAPENLQKSREN